jgi:hypothetical protein
MWIFEIRVLKTTFEPKNETVAGGRRIMTSFKIIRGIKSRRMSRKGGGHVVDVAEMRNAHRGFVETEVSLLFSQALKVAESSNIYATWLRVWTVPQKQRAFSPGLSFLWRQNIILRKGHDDILSQNNDCVRNNTAPPDTTVHKGTQNFIILSY